MPWVLAATMAAGAVWFLCLDMPLWASACVLVGLPLRKLWPRVGLVALALCIGAVTHRQAWAEIDHALDRLSARKHAYGPREVVAATGLNLGMAAGGLVAGMPEVAAETLLLHVPGSAERNFESDFAMHSVKVQRVVRRWAEAADRDGCASIPRRERITWSRYDAADDSLRVALALNSLDLRGQAHDSDEVCTLALVGRVRVAYPDTYRLNLGGGLSLDEGIFAGLARVGWMHPYTAAWHWSVTTTEARAQPERPELGWFERLLVSAEASPVLQLRDGDIVFQSSRSSQSEAIAAATHSRYTHMGIVFLVDGKPRVFEAAGRVQWTTPSAWRDRGTDGHWVVKRLRDSSALTPASIATMRAAAEDLVGRPYDAQFSWSDERIYCSELVYKLYEDALGIELGELQRLGDFDLSHPLVKSKLAERYGDRVPIYEPVVSPAAIFASPVLVAVDV